MNYETHPHSLNHRALQAMRSFANVMPGESRGCLGCHEQHSRAPQPGAITPVPWAYRRFHRRPPSARDVGSGVGEWAEGLLAGRAARVWSAWDGSAQR